MQNDLRVHPRTDQGPDRPSEPGPGRFDLPEPTHFLSPEDVVSLLHSDAELGLSDHDAHARLSEAGPNEISGEGGVSALRILMKQIFNAMVLVLILAMAVTFAIKSWIEAGVVTAVVIVNIVVGFFQEYSAEKTMNSLRALSSPTASAVRGGTVNVIRSADLVPGDIVEVKMGDTIPADLRLIEAMNFDTDEALLTGESLPVSKKSEALVKKEGADEIGVGDRINMAYSSSTVTRGRAKGIVVSTGMKTEIGKIAESLQGKKSRVRTPKKDEDGNSRKRDYAEAAVLTVWDQVGKFLGTSGGTPLQRKLSWLAIILFGVAVIFAIICMGANEFSDRPDVILYAVGTGLSMIPASLVVVLTITMAVGTKVMAGRNVIVRKLDSLEALGAVTNICSDKTGTLTQGKMVVKKAWVIAEGTYSVGDIQNPVDPTGSDIAFSAQSPYEDKVIPKTQAQLKAETDWKAPHHFYEDADREILKHYLDTATFCNIATVFKNKETEEWQARGDPTEIAIQVFASRFGHGRKKFTHGDKPTWTQLAEYPFDSDVKRMAVVFRKHSENPEKPDDWIFMKGAVERVIDSCSTVHTAEGEVAFTKEFQQKVIKNMESLASEGLRVLALAHRPANKLYHDWDSVDRGEVERDMCLLGLIGLYDPPRLETAGAVKACHRAGINVHMVTGDHPQTAKAIAIEVGIIPRSTHMLAPDVVSSMVMTASQFDKLSDQEIDDLPVLPLVIARCAPQTKVRMVDALHRRNKFVAMTGDGVNDSPALKRADVGIGMGMAGSDVAKDASDIVLTDDNFASILNSIEEGRRMFDNIKKFVLHLLAENIAQACTLLIGLAFKDKTGLSTFPLAPVEILWIIMITSGFPAMGLGLEKASADVMTRPPHNRRVGIFTKEVLVDLTVYGFWMAALCLTSFSLVVWGFGDGQLGHDCNNNYSDQCELVFRARSTTFVCLTWFALFLAWEMVHMRRSFFRMEPKPENPYTIWITHIWRNPFLFWSIFAGFVTVFPILYIPVINHKVFKHAPISWEWGIVFVEAFLFFAGVEFWKYCKRAYFRKYGDTVKNPESELAGQTFSRYTSQMTEASADASTIV